MKKTLTRILAVVLTIVMTITAIPFTGIDAKAAGVNGYCATAAAQWAIDHWQDIDSPLYGKGYWFDGGDCANFVSQCIYMGGIDQSTAWNHNGYYAHFGTNSGGSFIRAQQLYDYVVSIGGQSVQNPSASQVSVGDLIFFRREGSYRLTHSSIVTAVENGIPRIAYHSVYENGGYTKENTKNWTLGYAGKNIYLVKMNGSLCTAQKTRNFDVYTVKSGGANLYSGTSTSSGRVSTFLDGEYAHVYSTTSANGYTWGYTFRYGKWGWVQLNRLNYQRNVRSAVPTHLMGDWYVTKPSTCVTGGTEQRDCQRCTYYETRVITGGHVVKVHANCLEPGYCSLCGVKTENPLGHSFGAWSNTKNPTCTETGTRKHSCIRCGYSETETVAALGHNDAYTATAPTCTANGTATYKCSRCGRQTINYINANNTVSDWTTQVISGLTPVETKTQYRYKTKSTTTSYDTSMSGWTQNGGSWVQASTGSVSYVSSWPSGFDKNHSLYGTYNKTPPSASESSTKKTVINSDNHTGYIYWHYCRNNQSLNLNYPDRLVNDVKTSEFSGFHAYYSTTNYTKYDGSGNVVNAVSSGTCKDTQWYYKLNVYTRSYTNYNKLFNYYKWSDWSSWQDSSVSATSDRQVETRKLYKYNLAKMGHDFSVEGAREEATCTKPGYIGMKCSRCGAFSPDSIVIPAKGHELYNENSSRGWYVTKSTAAATEYRRDCQRFCGYFEVKTTNNACISQKIGEIAATCEKDGEITYKCSLHGEITTETIKAPGHEEDNNWILLDAASCANGGKDGKEICYCVRYDNGKTCSKVFERIIPAPDHVEVIDNFVASTCTQTGLTEGSHCNVCKEVIKEQKTVDALGHDDSGEWVRIIEPDCGVTGVEHLYCVRECANGEKCGFLIDIRYIDGLEPEYVEKERKESSCIDIGWVKYTCELCEGTDHEHGYTEFLELVDHIWSEYDVTDAVCIYPGEKTRSCTVCGLEDEPVIIPAEREEHDFIETTIPSTCVSGGISTKICSICEFEEDVDDPDPLGHDMKLSEERSYAPTCEEPGCNVFECIREGCDYEYSDPIDAVGHDYQPAEEHPATCVDAAYVIMVCQNDSSHTYKKFTTDPLGHDMGEWYVITEPTCSAQGLAQRDCQRDGCTYNVQKVLLINPDAHDWGDWFVDADPNCVDKGIEKRICNINNEHIQTKETVTDPDNHDMGEWYEVTKATCTEKGLEKRDCNRCDYSEERETAIDPDNHYAETFYTVDEKADCENDGKKSHHCERCDKSLDEVVISKRNHVYDNGVETKAPTCTQDGVKTFTCTNEETNEYKACTHSYTEVIPATGHDWGEWETETPATCEADGLEKRICKNDTSHVEDNVLTAIGHKWDNGVIDPDSTCKVHGTKTYTCQNDASHTKTEEVPLDENNHVGDTYTKDNKDATCTEDGYTGDIYCSDCDKKLSDGNVIPALGHDMGEWYEVTKATCTEKGLEKRDCNRCDYSEERETAIDPDNHYAETFYTVDEKADCENDGKKSHHCERCNKSLDEVVISKRNHVYDNGVETKAPTCLEDGVMTFTCTNEETNEYKACTHSYTDVIPATGHDWGDWETETPATCETDGLEKRICKNDASHVEENVLTAIGHKWDNGVINPASTCNTHGTKTYTCQNDASHTKTESVPLDENNHVGDTYLKDEKEPDCTNDGYTGDTYCSDCDKKLESGEVIPATGHDWGNWTTVKESSYTEMGTEKRICNNCGAEETRPLPVLTRPSDDNDNIETEKTVEYDSATGEAVIKLVASSKGEKITVNSRTPLDIVLVLDQSGSMEGNLLEKLKTATEDFANAIYQDAVNNNIDHRIAMVGFAMQNASGKDYPQYLNTEILSTGGAPVQYNSLSTAKMNEVYRNALVSVNVDGTLNPVLTLAKNNLEAKGATAADLGLDMACKVFAQNENDGSRKRIVVFMTDGVPTYSSGYNNTTAENAITKATLLKKTYDADVYSVGVLPVDNKGNPTQETEKYAKPFLKNIASKDENNQPLFFDSDDAEKLVEDFQTIATQSTTVTTDFADITLIDTVSSAFTLTAVQENELRKNAIEKLGITNDDITVTRYADGTTEVKLEHINPVAVSDGDDINYVIDIDFRVTANEKALIAGSYGTNTDNAGVLIGTTDVYENNFAVPGATVENAEGVIYFTVNGITYHMVRVHKGDTPEAPEFTLDGEYTFSGWDIPDEVVFDGGKLTVDATLTQKEYTVTWNTADGTMTDSYYAGDVIVVPEVGLNAKGDEVIGWNTVVPVTMPAENLEFTAIYGKHVHSYTENVLKKVSCGVEGKVQYICICGDSYTETLEPLTHKWVTSATSSDGTDTAYSHVYCENCGESPAETLEYTIVKPASGWGSNRKEVTYDLKLVDAESITIQPDGEITISLPVPQEMKYAYNLKIYRKEADGTLTNLNGTVKNGYITFTTDHFSIYIIEAEYECVETGNHTDEDADNICDICGNEIPVEEPSENCNHYCHQKGFMNFLWKIFNFLYRLFGMEAKRICECGAAHW